MFDALGPWTPNVDDIEPITTGKPSEQGVKFKLPGKKLSFFFGPAGCKLAREAATWDTAEETVTILDAVLSALTRISGITLGNKVTVISLHLQPKTISFKEILRPFLVPKITGLENESPEAMAIVSRWKNRRITLDGSAAIANAVYLQLEREFAADVTFAAIKTQLQADELELFKILDIKEEW